MAPAQAKPSETAQQSSWASIAAIVSGGIAFLFLPVFFGPVGIVMSILAKKNREPLAVIAMVVSILGTIVGFAFGLIVALLGYTR